MSSKNKSQRLNKHKGKACLKHRQRLLPAQISNKNMRGGEFVYVALDTNIIFRIIDVIQARRFRSIEEYNHACYDINFLFENFVYNANGSKNNLGRLVPVVLPEVLDELKNNTKYRAYHEEIADLIFNRMIVLSANKDREKEYQAHVVPLMKELEKNGLFLRNGEPSKDMKIWARAAFLNLTLITNDDDFKVSSKENISKIRSISARKLQGDHNGHIATPISLKNFKFEYNRKTKFSQPENTNFLSEESQKALTMKTPPEKKLSKETEAVR